MPLMLQISCSTVVQILDHILKPDILVLGTISGKKKKKSVDTDLLVDVYSKGENALTFLSSLLDILLLKKNIANRFVIEYVHLILICVYIYMSVYICT